MGVYWNLTRRQENGVIGKESGASFFVVDYGLHIINDANTCVAWDIGLYHGTGVYENGVEHIGVTMLLSDRIQSSWETYNRKLESGKLFRGQLHCHQLDLLATRAAHKRACHSSTFYCMSPMSFESCHSKA